MPFDALAILVLFGALAETGPTSTWAEYRPDGLSSFRLQGDILDVRRKLFEWEVRGELIEGYLRLGDEVFRDAKQVEGRVEIEVNALKGYKDGIPVRTNMNEIIREKLRVNKHPTIVFALHNLDLEAQPVQSPLPLRCVAQGGLVIAGVTNGIAVPLRLQFGKGERLTVTGEFSVRMSDYLIAPPVGGTTTLKSADRVWISFEWQLVRTHLSSMKSFLRKGHNSRSTRTAAPRLRFGYLG